MFNREMLLVLTILDINIAITENCVKPSGIAQTCEAAMSVENQILLAQ